ncbi:hypothetical protein CL659_05840 [bacterium]|nr:hypothetical protein [bacterium]|tara:strand:+ start:5252 stop:7351 length:2100 start_codon:yes stop_codon:yes gene_type:complete
MKYFFVQARGRRAALELLLILMICTTSVIFSQSYGMGMALSKILVPCVLGLLFSRFISTQKWTNIAGWFVEVVAAILFYIKISESFKNGVSVYDFLSDILPLFLILYTFKLVNARDIKFFSLIPFSVAVFVAGVSPSSLFTFNAIILSIVIIGLITGCPMLVRTDEDKRIQNEWFFVFKRYIARLLFIVFGLVVVSESIAPSKIIRNLGGDVQVGVENITPYRYTNFSSDIVPRSFYSGFSPFLNLSRKENVHLSEEPALEVTGPSTYWRGVVFDVFAGSSWESSRRSTRSIHSNTSINGFNIKPEEYRYFDFEKNDQNLIKINRSVTFLKSHGNFLFTPWIPNRISFGPINNFLSISNLYLNQSPNSAILTPFETQADFNYQIESIFTEGQRLQTGILDTDSFDSSYGAMLNPNIPNPNSNGLVEPYIDYLSLPEISIRVIELTESIAGQGDSIEKMERIAIYLRENMQYSLETDALPVGFESSDWFLFESQSGWCEMFASALGVMGRILNIKTRLVGGYQGGEKIAGKSSYLIREKDAHVWVEFWSEEHGWIPIDPTPESNLANSSESQSDSDAGAFSQVRKAVDNLVENIEFLTWSNRLDAIWTNIRIYLIGLFFLISFYGLIRFIRKIDFFSKKRLLVRKIRKWIHLAKKDGVSKRNHETLREFALRWHVKTKKSRIINELKAFEIALYGKSSFF